MKDTITNGAFVRAIESSLQDSQYAYMEAYYDENLHDMRRTYREFKEKLADNRCTALSASSLSFFHAVLSSMEEDIRTLEARTPTQYMRVGTCYVPYK